MSEMVLCRGCGKRIHLSARACPNCGATRAVKKGGGGKSKAVAGVLAILLGGFGIHRFYLGQWRGLLYLLFCWTMIPGLISLIEGVVFLCTSDEKWDDKYNDGVPSQSGNGAVVGVILVVGLIGGVAVLGILAAIALPAYQDYTIRARVAQTLMYAKAASILVQEHVHKHGTYPQTLEEAGFRQYREMQRSAVLSVSPKSGTVTVSVQMQPVLGKTFVLVPEVSRDGQITAWHCRSGDLPSRYLPRECR